MQLIDVDGDMLVQPHEMLCMLSWLGLQPTRTSLFVWLQVRLLLLQSSLLYD